MRFTLILLLMITLQLNAKTFQIELKGMNIGKISDITTIEKGYLKAKARNFLVRLALGSKYLVLYDERVHPTNQKNIKYKKDSNKILFLISYAMHNDIPTNGFHLKINDKKYIQLEKFQDYNSSGKISFKYFSNKKLKSNGYIKIKNQKFVEFVDDIKRIKITSEF